MYHLVLLLLATHALPAVLLIVIRSKVVGWIANGEERNLGHFNRFLGWKERKEGSAFWGPDFPLREYHCSHLGLNGIPLTL